MSAAGGHWLWSASLRYVFMIMFLLIILFMQGGFSRLIGIFKLFAEYWLFWCVSGSIGFGLFYALICFSADSSPGWVIAATWQFTVVASLFVFMFFGRTFPKRIWMFSLMIFIGVCFVNLSHIDNFSFQSLMLGGIPVLIAAFCFPFGNQLVWEAKHGTSSFIPKINSPLLNNSFNKVMLLSLGSLPVWIVLVLVLNPELPKYSQILNTSLVALFSGVAATSIFLYARNHASNTNELAAVDATQSSQVVFVLIASIIFLDSSSINLISMIGLFMILFGLILFVKYQNKD